ncbi:MAG: glycosyltransferase, partial [Bradymonadaceae bacterium]
MIDLLEGFSGEDGPIVVVGGGTGGHVFPGIAVADAVRERRPDREIVFVGTPDGLEADVVPGHGYPFRQLDVPPLKGREPLEWARASLELTRSGVGALSLLRELHPSLVVGAGGYVAGPLTLGASLVGIPTVLLEQNASPGMTTRAL